MATSRARTDDRSGARGYLWDRYCKSGRGLLRKLDGQHVMMMGDNPALARFPPGPTLLDFSKLRFQQVTARHLLTSPSRALDAGQSEKIVRPVCCTTSP